MTSRPRIAIVGAGLGGLALAQGLRRHGLEPTVYEREPDADTRRQGYRLHVDARAGLALETCLPPELFALFLATCGQPSRRFTVLSKRLRTRHQGPVGAGGPETAATLSTSVNRRTLREVLLAGLDDRVHFGQTLTGYETRDDVVVLRFATGATTEADVLVGADGVGSAVRRQYLPQAELVDIGTRCVYGKTLLTGETEPLLPAALHDGFTAIVSRGVGMATGLVRFRESPPAAAARLAPYARLSPTADYLMWAVTADRGRFPASDDELAGRPANGLHAVAARMVRSWHPDIRALVARAEVDETFFIRIATSVPVPPWPPSRVTLLGDAIHAMSPARGSGANTALTDAAVLTGELASGDRDTVVAAVGAYEERMRAYGFAAVRAAPGAD